MTPPPIWPKTSNKTTKILHLSDPHVQLDYTVGADTDCGKVVCCSSKDPMPVDPTKKAGIFGDYHCDLPINTLDTLLAHARLVNLNQICINYPFLMYRLLLKTSTIFRKTIFSDFKLHTLV